jgi:hypothetical protein
MFNATSKFIEYVFCVNRYDPADPKLNGVAINVIDLDACDDNEK